jgi:hypothetical protein
MLKDFGESALCGPCKKSGGSHAGVVDFNQSKSLADMGTITHQSELAFRGYNGLGTQLIVSKEIIFEFERSPEGGYEASALGYSIYTEAETLAGLRQMARDAVNCHFDGESNPSVIRFHRQLFEV